MDSSELSSLVTNLESKLDSVSPLMKNLTSSSLTERLTRAGSPQESVEIANSYSAILCSLLETYMNLLGINPESHEIASEVERIKRYASKLNKFLGKEEKQASVESNVAKRLISAAVGKSSSISTDNKVIKSDGKGVTGNATSRKPTKSSKSQHKSKKNSGEKSQNGRVSKPDKPKKKKKSKSQSQGN
ncbi:hypothetical protein DASC09_020310 [Saccharomycopsis crataegensis]|uniref:Exosome complex protein n=1 Tax=Saccharomycopsis crataegensis TaxID=43959 RepID=A0AAV5QJ44_9ASCO|nr:hypothetical protein DASC09_020310 [Saccharomycopsis crataegensis]